MAQLLLFLDTDPIKLVIKIVCSLLHETKNEFFQILHSQLQFSLAQLSLENLPMPIFPIFISLEVEQEWQGSHDSSPHLKANLTDSRR